MPIEIHWQADDQMVLRIMATDPWNWKDFHKHMRVATFWLDKVDHGVDLLLDLRQSHKLPAGALGHIRSLGKAIHPNGRDRLVVVALDESIAGPLGGKDGLYSDGTRLIRFVDSDEEAQAVIRAWLAN
jgi:hypothetical protein